MHDESLYAERALLAGASGYIMKQEAPDKIITAIRHIRGGNIYVSEQMCSKMLNTCFSSHHEKIASTLRLPSDRELEV
jgi:DNA-binding NarL/FixJ family response regulator